MNELILFITAAYPAGNRYAHPCYARHGQAIPWPPTLALQGTYSITATLINASNIHPESIDTAAVRIVASNDHATDTQEARPHQ